MASELGLAAVLPQRGWEALKAMGWSVQKPRPRHPASGRRPRNLSPAARGSGCRARPRPRPLGREPPVGRAPRPADELRRPAQRERPFFRAPRRSAAHASGSSTNRTPAGPGRRCPPSTRRCSRAPSTPCSRGRRACALRAASAAERGFPAEPVARPETSRPRADRLRGRNADQAHQRPAPKTLPPRAALVHGVASRGRRSPASRRGAARRGVSPARGRRPALFTPTPSSSKRTAACTSSARNSTTRSAAGSCRRPRWTGTGRRGRPVRCWSGHTASRTLISSPMRAKPG